MNSYSKEYHQQKAKEHYQANRAEYLKRNQEQKARTRNILNEAKSSGCTICSENDTCCLDFHHLGDKDMVISKMLGMNDARVKAEISKCVVLCRNCHAKVHAGKIQLQI